MTIAEVDVELGQAQKVPDVDLTHLLQALSNAPPAVLVITVFNGGDAVGQCLRSVLTHTSRSRILVIDDASTEPAIVELLDRHHATGMIDLVRHDVNWGYTRTINHAIELTADDDVVLLNSDTVVGPLWLERLRWVAYSRPRVASVTAASDNAGAMSLPDVGTANDWVAHLGWDELARFVAGRTKTWAQTMPTANGFCVYLPRSGIQEVGNFDVASFPRGYGEENDWSMRALGLGLVNLFAPHVFVKHVRSQSFGPERADLAAAGRAMVDNLHADYTASIRHWRKCESSVRISKQATAIQSRAATVDDVRPRRLYVLHRTGGGTPATNLDLIGSLRNEQESYLLESLGGRSMVLSSIINNRIATIRQWAPEVPYTVDDRWDDAYAEFVAGILIELNIELIHVRHLIHTPIATLPEVARRLGVRLIYSTHDFHPVCPTITLLDEEKQFCGGTCTPGTGNCTLPEVAQTLKLEPLKNGWVHEWRGVMARVVEGAEAVIATTPSAGDVIRKAFPESSGKVTIVEHGRDVGTFAAARGDQRRFGPLRILAPAIWAPHKGIDYLKAVADRVGDDVEWHILGKGGEQLGEVGVVHGDYTRANLVRLVQAIDPDFVGLFSIWPETYSHTLTEAWAMEVPVLATNLGAFRDRITHLGGGHLLPLDVDEAAELVLGYARDLGKAHEMRRGVPATRVRHPQTMANDYARLYDRSRLERPTVGIIDQGRQRDIPATAHVRVYRRALAARAQGALRFERVLAQDYATGLTGDHFDALVVVRNALRSENAELVLARARAQGVRVVLDLDDDLVSEHAIARLVSQGWDPEELNTLRDVVTKVDHVIASTAPLASLLASLNPAVTIVSNSLDPRLWRREVAPVPVSQLKTGQLRVLYMGSATHSDDLALVDGVFQRVRAILGRRVVLEVVGVTEGEGIPGMRRIKPRFSDYPGFVTWLRQSSSRWHAGIAPLRETEFNAHKSDLKLLEYAAMGLPAIASNAGPYAGQTDLATLTDNTTQGWVAALVDLLGDDSAMRDGAADSHDLVLRERMLDAASTQRWCATVLGS